MATPPKDEKKKIKVKKDFSRVMYDYVNGKNMEEPVKEIVNGKEEVTDHKAVTFQTIAVRALMNPCKGDDNDAIGRGKAFALGVKVSGEQPLELDMDELTLIKDRVRKQYTAPMLSEQMAEFIEEDTAK